MKNSKLFKLNLNDFTKGLVIVLLTASISTLYQSYTQVPPSINWQTVLNNSIMAGLAYILKQVGTNSKGEVFKKENDAK
jgi:hypothetical protein